MSNNSNSSKIMKCIALVIVLLVGYIHFSYGENKVPLQGTHYLHNNDVEMVYQIPTASPKGVLFLAHGCSHSAIDWWPKSSTCEHCIGLPIEMTIVQEAVNNNYAVLAISSINRAHKCWVSRDLPRSQEAIEYFYSSILKLTPNNFIPLHLAGGSSGGGFVGALAQTEHLKPPASTACIIISGTHITNTEHIPPLLYILMPKDSMTSMRVNTAVAQTSHLKYKILNSVEKPITPDFFQLHSLGSITEEESKTIQLAFLAAGVIDRTTLLLKDDPRQSHWRDEVLKAVPHMVPSRDTLHADESTLSELMNNAFAMHEITAEYKKEMMTWFDEHNRIPSPPSHA